MSPHPDGASAEARRIAEALAPVFTAFERLCLQVGERLAGAVPGLNALSGRLAAVSDELQGPQMLAANADLEAIAQALTLYPSLLESEEGHLRVLIEKMSGIDAQVQLAETSARTLGALVFSLRIEAAQFSGRNSDLMDFARSLKEIVVHVQASLTEYARARATLDGRLRSAASYLTEFKQKHISELTRLSLEIERSMETLSHRRIHAASLLGDVASQSRGLGALIGECVSALQIGDATRQRTEHVAQALILAADALDCAKGAPFVLGLARYDGDPHGLARRLLELQARQIEGARSDFAKDTARIVDLVARLSADAGGVEARSVKLFGSDDSADASFLQALGRNLSVAREVVEEGARTRVGVDDAKSSTEATMARMEARIGELTAIAADVSMIGTNASLRSSRLGDDGRGVTLIAAELRDLGRTLHGAIEEIARLLTDMGGCMKDFGLVRGVDAASLAELAQRMSRGANVFDGAGATMAEALQKLRAESSHTRGELDVAARALGDREPAAFALTQAEREIGQLARAMPRAESAEADRFLDEALGPVYSMSAERRIHHALTGAFAEATPDEDAGLAPADADAFML